MSKRFYCESDRAVFGPLTSSELKSLASDGRLKADDLVWYEGGDRKYRARNVEGLFKIPAITASTEPQPAVSRCKETAHAKFSNPLSTFLNTLATVTVDSLATQTKNKALSQADFNNQAREILEQLRDAVAFLEGNSSGSAEHDREPSQSRGVGTSRDEAQTQVSRLKRGEFQNPSSASTLPQPSARGTGATALQIGGAALLGGAWGYLLGQRGNQTDAVANHGIVPSDSDGHSVQYAFGDGNLEFTNAVDAGERPEAIGNVIGADTNNDGLLDSFYGDRNGDGIADVVGNDSDFDGNIDHVDVDTDYDGDLDAHADLDDDDDFDAQDDLVDDDEQLDDMDDDSWSESDVAEDMDIADYEGDDYGDFDA